MRITSNNANSYMERLRVRENVALASLSTFKIGGRARFLVEVDSDKKLIETIRWAKERNLEWRVMAGGSNIVFPDGGMGCLLIRVFGGEIKVSAKGGSASGGEGYHLTVDAGVLLGDVVKKSISLGLRGLETLSGIPGTIAGAVYGNAGAYGRSIAESVEKVEVLISQLSKFETRSANRRTKSEKFQRRWISNAQCGFGYRESVFKKKDWVISRVVLRLEEGDKKELGERSREIIKMREKKYKPGIRCPGSFFKNVLVKDVSKKSLALVDSSKIIDGKIPSGWLLEQVGAKGMRVGGIYIADFHGNLFVNDGKGTARDVKVLARKLKVLVRTRFGIELDEEVRYF